eukprot:2684847-Rhodomonas_salina.1
MPPPLLLLPPRSRAPGHSHKMHGKREKIVPALKMRSASVEFLRSAIESLRDFVVVGAVISRGDGSPAESSSA